MMSKMSLTRKNEVMRVKALGELGSLLQRPIDPVVSHSDRLRRPRMPSLHDPYSSQPCKKGSNVKKALGSLASPIFVCF